MIALNRFYVLKGSLKDRLALLFIWLVVSLMIIGLLSPMIEGAISDARNAFLVKSMAQCLIVFIVPSFLVAFLTTPDPVRYLGVGNNVSFRQFGGVFLVILLMMPVINLVVDWNENLHLPSSMKGIEETMRNLEDTAAATTEMLLGDTSVWGLVSGILVVGVLTGFAEECFFRAGIQKALVSAKLNKHVAVWTTAIIFSTLHFQFFGFFPRMILGAIFGYIYLTSGSLWIAASAHALNNSLVVISSWLVSRGVISADLDKLGVEGAGSWIWLTISALFSIMLVTLIWKQLFSPKKQLTNGEEK